MRSLFSGNRHSAPLGPPKGSRSDMRRDPTKPETLQAVRQRQRDKQRHYVIQMMRAEKDRDEAHDAGHTEKAASAEAQRRQMSDAADALNHQVMIIERIMEEFGLSLDLEEEARANNELLEESREAYEHSAMEADQSVREQMERNQYFSTITSAPFINPNEFYSAEDEAMRDLDDCARKTGRV